MHLHLGQLQKVARCPVVCVPDPARTGTVVCLFGSAYLLGIWVHCVYSVPNE